MDYILYLFRSIYRHRWWILIGSFLITLLVYSKLKDRHGNFYVETTLYTGVISGYGLEENDATTNYAIAQNAIDNLITIIQSESTLKRVSIRLFSRVLIKGNPNRDQNQITSASYNATYNHLRNSPHGKELIKLIDHSSEDRTVNNFMRYLKPDKSNYIYGLFYYTHPFYSLKALKEIKVERISNSDLLKINYSNGDPSITYQTINILMTEFVYEYRQLRYGETDKVISYFKSQLDSIGRDLANHEDNLTSYNVKNKIINYADETKEIAAINKEYALRDQEVAMAYYSSKAQLKELEKQMDENTKRILSNIKLVDKIRQASSLTGKITEMETIGDSLDEGRIQVYKNRLSSIRKDLSNISNQYIEARYGKTGLAKATIVQDWLDQTLLYEKAKAEMKVVQKSRRDLDQKYVFYAPIGTTIKRKERVINFSEQNYLTNLQSYNEALLRKKNLEMTSASLKVLNPPAYPLSSESIARRKIALITAFVTFILLTIIFLIIELIDRTLRDSIRTAKVVGCPVLASFPNKKIYNVFSKTYENKATLYLSNAILRFFNNRKENEPYVLNLLSIEEECGKTYIANKLEEHWKNIGLNVRHIEDGIDYTSDSPDYLLAKDLSAIYEYKGEDILIVEHSALDDTNIPTPLLKHGNLNLLVVSGTKGWKSTDKILLNKLIEQLDGNKPYLCLNRALSSDLESYVGMLPPYTPWRKLSYRLSQLALTEKGTNKFHFWKHKNEEDYEEDDYDDSDIDIEDEEDDDK